MEERDLAYLVSACAAELLSGSPALKFSRVCSDSRQLQPGDVFFAIRGDRFDGHNFVHEAAAKGAVAVVVEKARQPEQLQACAVIAVTNARTALGRLAAAYRNDFSIPVVAVGGSNGKTSTKEMLAAILSEHRPTLWSEASFNNDIGVPMTMLRLERKHEAAVFEVGTNHPGELAPLVRMIQPQYGIITMIGREHLEFFGDVAGVAEEEGWLGALLPANGKLFLNGDNEWTEILAKRTRATVVRCGFNEGNTWRAREVQMDERGSTFQVESPNAAFNGEYRINLLGRHQVVNTLLAVAVGESLGVSRTATRSGLANCKPAKMRLQLSDAGGARLLDDTYNANADSMGAALRTLKDFPCTGRRVAVLGDMAELGAHSEAAHEEVGRQAAEHGVNQLFAVGRMAPLMARGARAAGLMRVIELADVEVACGALRSFLRPGDVVLLKASRSSRLERITDFLRGPK